MLPPYLLLHCSCVYLYVYNVYQIYAINQSMGDVRRANEFLSALSEACSSTWPVLRSTVHYSQEGRYDPYSILFVRR